jgi:DNA primase
LGRLLGHSDVDSVREATDLVRLIGEHISLRPRGREHVGVCPFHDDHAPSMAVVTHKGNAFFKCHACGAGGDAFDFVMNYHKMEFPEALRYLADRAGITLTPRRETSSEEGGGSRADLRKVNAFAATFFQRMLNDTEAGAAASEVIQQRGISDDMIRAFGLGAAPNQWDALVRLVERRSLPQTAFIKAGLIKQRPSEPGCYDAFRNRVIFPICDELGNPIAFGARKINPDDEPKYLNSAESAVFSKSQTLYGLHLAKLAVIETKQVIVTEGYTDVIACHQAGITNVVGTLGTALTADHAKILSRLCDAVVLIFDGDEAGQRAADRAVSVFFSQPVDIRICVLPDDLDPDELLKLDGGRERFMDAAARSIDALQYRVKRFRSQLDPAVGLSARQKRLEAFLAELGELGFAHVQGVRKSLVMSQLSELLNVPMPELEKALPRQRRDQRAAGSTPATSVSSSSGELMDGDDRVPRARRVAERDLLAILVYEPHLARQPVNDSPVTSQLKPHDFAVEACRAIAEPIFEALLHGRTMTVQQVLASLDNEHHRRLASSLYFHGQALCGETSETASAALATAVAALHECARRERFQQSAAHRRESGAPTDLVQAIADLRQRHHETRECLPALAQGVRT